MCRGLVRTGGGGWGRTLAWRGLGEDRSEESWRRGPGGLTKIGVYFFKAIWKSLLPKLIRTSNFLKLEF